MPVAIPIILGVTAAAGVADAVVQAKAASSQKAIAGQELGMAATQQQKQNQLYAQLQQLISNPSGFTSSPAFTSTLTAAQRAQAAAGYGGSTNEVGALQSLGFNELLAQEQTLMGGAGVGFNPVAGGSAASSATSAGAASLNSSLNQLGGLAGMFAFMQGGGMNNMLNTGTAGGAGAGLYDQMLLPSSSPNYTGTSDGSLMQTTGGYFLNS